MYVALPWNVTVSISFFMWLQKIIQLKKRTRGFHLITREIMQQLPELSDFNIGIMHVFIQHTSASLTLNENADPSVR